MNFFSCAIISLSVAMLTTFSAFAQRTERVTASYTYIVPSNVSLDVARETALERAKLQAIADEFGTIVSQHNSTVVSNKNGESNIDFLSLGGSEVKGEWIETIGDPSYDISFQQGMLVVRVEAQGRIREIISAPINFVARILCNGTEDRFERTDFRSGDDLFLSFRSPVNGFLAVYLVDNNNDAFCLLPYQAQTNGVYPIEANRQYILFSEEHASVEEKGIVDEYTMTANEAMERNQIFVIFSPNPFTKATDSMFTDGLPRQLEWRLFQKWLASCRARDGAMRIEKTLITIKRM